MNNPTNTACEWNDNNRCLVVNNFEIQAWLDCGYRVYNDAFDVVAEFDDLMDAISWAATFTGV